MMLIVGAASGLVGSFALMRKMTLASDSVSHIALPGLGVAILLGINPLLGAAAALFIGVLLIWGVEKKSSISTDILIGVVFSASLAIGSLLATSEELLDELFGQSGPVSLSEVIIAIAAAILVIVVILKIKDRLALSVISRDLAKTTGVRVDIVNLIYLATFALTIVLGIRFVGILLMGSMIIIPAAISKNLAWNLKSDLWISAIAAMICITIGYYLAQTFSIAVGPIIISTAAILFFVSLSFKRS